MIYINIEGLLALLNEKTPKKVTLSEMASETGITRKALSRLKNHPTDSISSQHLGTLCEYFFHKFLPFKLPERSHALLMDWVVSAIIQVYPDNPAYKFEFKHQRFGRSGLSDVTGPIAPSMLWNMYEMKNSTGEEDDLSDPFIRRDLYTLLFESTSAIAEEKEKQQIEVQEMLLKRQKEQLQQRKKKRQK